MSSHMLRIVTLGPAGTNHALVARRYMAMAGIEAYEIRFVTCFADAVQAVLRDEADIILQCAVHPETPNTLGGNFRQLFAIDSFITDSQELGILSRKGGDPNGRLGILLPANARYADTSRWRELVNATSLPIIAERLLAGELDAGLTYTRYAAEHPDLLQVEEVIGSPDDVWIVYGRDRVARSGEILGNAEGDGIRQIRKIAGM